MGMDGRGGWLRQLKVDLVQCWVENKWEIDMIRQVRMDWGMK